MDFPLLGLLTLMICYFVFAFAMWSKHRAEQSGEVLSDQSGVADEARDGGALATRDD